MFTQTLENFGKLQKNNQTGIYKQISTCNMTNTDLVSRLVQLPDLCQLYQPQMYKWRSSSPC